MNFEKSISLKIEEMISSFGSKELALKCAEEVYAVRSKLKSRDYIEFVKFWVKIIIELRK